MRMINIPVIAMLLVSSVTYAQDSAGLQAASAANLRNAQQQLQQNPGSSPQLAQAAIQMAQTLNSPYPSDLAETARTLANILTNTSDATSACPTNFDHLSSEMPEFHDPKLREIRQDILATNLASIVVSAKQQGLGKNQAISLALQQADEFESTARQNAAAGAGVSTELTARGIVTSVRTGQLSLDIPCNGSASMVQAAQCGVILQIWGAMANREQAKYMETCW